MDGLRKGVEGNEGKTVASPPLSQELPLARYIDTPLVCLIFLTMLQRQTFLEFT